jgi:RNA exonuclease 4
VTSYRTEFSGIEPHMLEGAPSVETVQREVREVVQGRIVVGHGLENDFGVLGLNHPRHLVRDTAHDLPRLLRSNGKPRKLRHITYEWLGLTIQGGEGGHDPCEDARAALLLYQRFQRQFDEQVALRERARAKVEAQRATEQGEKEAGLADDAAAAADAATGCAATAARGSPPAVSTATRPSRRRVSKGGKSSSNKYRL